MTHKRLLLTLLILASLVGGWLGGGSTAVAQGQPPAKPDLLTLANIPEELRNGAGIYYAPGEVLAGFYRDRAAAAAISSDWDAEAVEPLDLRGLDGAGGDAGVAGARLRVPVGQEWETIARLLADPAVAFAEPNWIVRAAGGQAIATPEAAFEIDDTLYAEEQWYMQRINASRAWQLAEELGAQATIQVAIVDSGVDAEHPEFAGRLLPGENYVDPGSPPVDDFGHGTHIAGVVGAILNNNAGMSGLALKVRIDPYRVLDQDGNGFVSDVADAIRASADAGADIINLSLEIPASVIEGTPSLDNMLHSAVWYAQSRGALMIAAGGNNARTKVPYPAAYPEVFAVAATTYYDGHAYYSASGSPIDIAAPGGDSAWAIYSAWSRDAINRCKNGNYQRVDGGDYCNSIGTSMSAGIVSGVAALVWSLQPEMTAGEVRDLLTETATPLDLPPEDVGAGRIDAYAAVRRQVAGDLQVDRRRVSRLLLTGSTPFSVTVTLSNPSLDVVEWEASLASTPSWVRIAGTTTNRVSGEVRYGHPARVTLAFSPSALTPGAYQNRLNIDATLPGGKVIVQPVDIALSIADSIQRRYLPLVAFNGGATTGFQWETPGSGGRSIKPLTDDSSVTVTLPFTFPLKETTYTDLRLNSDGFVVLPGSDSASAATNRCLPSPTWPNQAVYGWWADLDPSAAGAQVSTFQPDTDRFVVEFSNVPAAAKSGQAYTVSFQIVLERDGDIKLNYLDTPLLEGAPPPATVGAEAGDGRFSNLVFCADPDAELGDPPHSGQSLKITPGGLF